MWTLPGQLPDESALERIRQRFPRPNEVMPEPWFMSGEVNYYTWLAEVSPEQMDTRSLGDLFRDIGGGLLSFPQVSFVPTWKAWFKYLLPYAIVRANEQDQFSSLLPSTISTLMTIYPYDIAEEYDGFRADVISTLGTRAIPLTLARDLPREEREQVVIINEIWDFSFFYSDEGPCPELSLPVLFCLRYLRPSELERWVTSCLEIDSAQFRFEFILWWLAFRKFLRLAQDWPTTGDLSALLDSAGLVDPVYSLPPFPSLDAFISSPNRAVFQHTLARQLTFDRFQQWSNEMKSKADYYLHSIEQVLQRFASEFFPPV